MLFPTPDTRHPTPNPRSPNPDTRTRGSVIVLVVVVIVLLAILGMSYMQVVRVQRQNIPQAQGDIEAVKDAIIAQILTLAADDIRDDNSDFLNQADVPLAAPGYTYTEGGVTTPNAIQTGRDEPYDYPWTNTDAQHTFISILGGSTLTSDGGAFDDIWLASTAPVDVAGDMVWPQITNLAGLWLDIPDPVTGPALPEEYGTTGDNNQDTGGSGLSIASDLGGNKTGYLPRGADASGNGILDSRWTWASLPQVGGVAYTMAVRIVDLSAMANANVALSQTDSSGAFDVTPTGTDAPRWLYPSELDLSGPVYEIINGLASVPGAVPYMNTLQAMGELDELLKYRLSSATTLLPTPWGFTFGQRGDYWLNGPSYYGLDFGQDNWPGTAPNRYNSLTIADEMALRWREGVKQEGTATTLEDKMHTFLRRDAVGETGTDAWKIALANMGLPAAEQKIENYYRYEPRHQLTILSGASIYAPRLTGDPDRVVKQDVNHLLEIGKTETPVYDSLAQEINKVLDTGSPTTFVTPTGSVAALTQHGFVSPNNLNFAHQLAANLADYGDDDNKITQITVTAGSEEYYGMETLPFISEVYVQGKYSISSVAPAVAPGPYVVTWDLQATGTPQVGYAIEIRNPFDVPVNLSTVELWIGGTNLGLLSNLVAGVVGFPTNAVLEPILNPKDVLILWCPSDNDAATGDDDVYAMVDVATDSANYTYYNVKLDQALVAPFAWPIHTNGAAPLATAAVEVELRAMVVDLAAPPGAPATWAYSKVTSHALPDQYDETYTPLSEPSTPPTIGSTGYMQRVMVGNGNGINTALVAPVADAGRPAMQAFALGSADPSVTAASPAPPSTTLDALGLSNKGAVGAADTVDVTTDQWIIADRGEPAPGVGPILHVGEMLQVAVIGPSPTKTVAEAWGGSTYAITDFMLDPEAAALIDTENYAVTHAQFLVERFTTMSPLVDGVDNDGIAGTGGAAGVDNNEETFIPGVINLNTATRETLERVLPINDATLRGEIADAIIAHRENPSAMNANRGTTLKGIAYVSELYPQLVALMRNPTYVPAGNTKEINSTRVDFTPDPSASNDDVVVDDREEELLLLNFLMQTCTTRSDRFAAYVLIHGYPAGDFRNGGEGPIESLRFFFVFDRSALVDETSTGRVLGVMDVK